MQNNEESTIRIKKYNKERMKKIGEMGNSYDDIIEKLLEFYESKNKKKTGEK
ncbi:MAG: hypothetical protein WC613_01225 [Candidatus Aenigmatarchaeota archaeon]